MDKNLSSVDDKIESVDARLGVCSRPSMGDHCITTWDGISFLEEVVNMMTSTVEGLEQRQANLHSDLLNKITQCPDRMDLMLSDVSTGFNDISAFLKLLNDEQTSLNFKLDSISGLNTPSALSSGIQTELDFVKTKLASLESVLNARLTSTFNGPDVGQQNDISSLKIQLKLLEARLPTHNILKLGGCMFQSRADVALFVESKMPSNCFALFHDVITLMERLTGNYIERKEVINEWYQATKVGLDEREARHIASFKITYPTVFGHVKEGTTVTKNHLPAVKSFKEWNSFDSETGVKSFILNGMEDLKLQVYQDIANLFVSDQFYDAQVLANDMHSKSQIFVAEMTNWMDVFYQELLATSKATEEEAWELVSACIKRVFEDLRRVRAGAANATTETGPSSKCSTIMWALVQSHRVMKEFLDMRFRNHPSIAPVIILHVFKTRVTRVAFSNQVKRIEGRVAKLESTPAFKNPRPPAKEADGDKKSGKG